MAYAMKEKYKFKFFFLLLFFSYKRWWSEKRKKDDEKTTKVLAMVERVKRLDLRLTWKFIHKENFPSSSTSLNI